MKILIRLNLLWVHMSEGRFFDVAAQIKQGNISGDSQEMPPSRGTAFLGYGIRTR